MHVWLPEGGGGQEKKSAQIKNHKGNGTGATEEAAEGGTGCRPHANRLGKQCTALR